MTTNTAAKDRVAVQACLTKFLALPDGSRHSAEVWEAWLVDYIRQTLLDDGQENPCRLLDNFMLAWSRLV